MRRSERTPCASRVSWFGALLCCFALAQSSPRRAHAEDAERAEVLAPSQLTSRGRLLGSGMIGGSWTSGGGVQTTDSFRIHASPALTYFLRDRVGLGFTLGGSISRTNSVPGVPSFRGSDLFVGVLAAFDLPVSEQLSVLLQPAFHYVNQWNDSSAPDTEAPPTLITFPNSLHLQIVRPALGLQLVVRVSPHLGFAFGPDFWADIVVDDGGLRRIQAKLTDKKQRYIRTQLGFSAGLLLSF